MTRSARGLSATAELLVGKSFVYKCIGIQSLSVQLKK